MSRIRANKITNQLEYIGIANSYENIWNLPEIYNKGYEDMNIINKVLIVHTTKFHFFKFRIFIII